jgi:hypothetical protein
MRWTDLPPDRGAADAGASALTRGEWDELRQRLERLPPGHPSRPGDQGLADDEDLAGDRSPDGDGPDASGSPVRRGVKDNEESRRRDSGGRSDHRAGTVPIDGRREPYRPWFTAGESPEPWFAADSGE